MQQAYTCAQLAACQNLHPCKCIHRHVPSVQRQIRLQCVTCPFCLVMHSGPHISRAAGQPVPKTLQRLPQPAKLSCGQQHDDIPSIVQSMPYHMCPSALLITVLNCRTPTAPPTKARREKQNCTGHPATEQPAVLWVATGLSSHQSKETAAIKLHLP
jgi:hypothetical protein